MTNEVTKPLLEFRGGTQLRPFIIYTAGRSRTLWLSAFLNYGVCKCHFEGSSILGLRRLGDVLSVLEPGRGSAETSAAPAWPLLERMMPDLRVVVVKRDVNEIVESIKRSAAGRLAIEEVQLRRIITYLARCLDKIAERPNALTVTFEDLASEDMCRAIFEHCLPYAWDKGWWEYMREKNLQVDLVELTRMYEGNMQNVAQLSRDCRHWLFSLVRRGQMNEFRRHFIVQENA